MAKLHYKGVWKGQPITKKNSMQIIQLPVKGKAGAKRPCLIQSKQYREYEKNCLAQIVNGKGAAQGRLHVVCKYWMKTARFPDLSNLCSGTHDLLQKGGVIIDDKNIVSMDGSRIMGKDAKNPRAEIEVYVMEDWEK